MPAGLATHRWLPIADAIEVVAQHLAISPAQAWAEIKSNAIRGLLALRGIDERGLLLDIEPHWLHYIEPWGSGDMPDRESGSMIAFNRERAIRDWRSDQREGRQVRSVPPSRIRGLEMDQQPNLTGSGFQDGSNVTADNEIKPAAPATVPSPGKKRPGPKPTAGGIVNAAVPILAAGRVPGKTVTWETFREEICKTLGVKPETRGYGLDTLQKSVRPLINNNQEV
jgi:hypothetical protein